MTGQFNASAVTAGTLISTNTFSVPPYQREYAWTIDEYTEFWDDIRRSLGDESYFLGLIILTTDSGLRKQVVDGQQRLLSITLLATALYREAISVGRSVLADRIQADFLQAIDYNSDDQVPRVELADPTDSESLRRIVAGNIAGRGRDRGGDDYSRRLFEAYDFFVASLHDDLAADPFRRLGLWTDFLTNRLLVAVFIHPDAASAYRVFEVINTRGRELTTADLLKNYVLSETPMGERDNTYARWQAISKPLSAFGSATFVQFIRHVLTIQAGHVLPKDLFDFVAGRMRLGTVTPPTAAELVTTLEAYLPLYLQMLDPSAAGPAEPSAVRVFQALNDLNVIAVRPLLMAINDTPDKEQGMEQVLDLVVRRIVVGNLGTGNVERRLGEAARDVGRARSWIAALRELQDLNPRSDEFVQQLARRSLNPSTLQFVRRSIVQATKTPEPEGFLHFIRPRQGGNWPGFNDEALTYWGSTIGNTLLVTQERRPWGSSTWDGVQRNLLPLAIAGERVAEIEQQRIWDADTVERLGEDLAELAATVWYHDA